MVSRADLIKLTQIEKAKKPKRQPKKTTTKAKEEKKETPKAE
tara:strand:- start:3774 stop:3899 length:126 start_codon:yes stop_codon:yes gene_type:complete